MPALFHPQSLALAMLHLSLLCSSLLVAPPRIAPRRAAAGLRVRDSVMHASPTRRELLQLMRTRPASTQRHGRDVYEPLKLRDSTGHDMGLIFDPNDGWIILL